MLFNKRIGFPNHIGIFEYNNIFEKDTINSNFEIKKYPDISRKKMKVIFQIIRNHPTQSFPAIIIFFDKSKYIFNVPETFQRFLKFHHFRMSKGSKIFLTRMGTDTITGLFGFLLTMYETETCLETKLYGPRDLIPYIESIKFLMGFKLLPYSCYGFNENAKEKANNTLLGIKRLEVLETMVESKTYLQDFYNINGFIDRELKNDPKEINDASQHIDFPSNCFKDENMTILPVIFSMSTQSYQPEPLANFFGVPQLSREIISYICITKQPEIKINKEKLASYNLNKQQTAELFKVGQTTLLDGSILRKEDLQGEISPSAILMIIDCPSVEIAQKLFENALLDGFSKGRIDKKQYQVQAIIHLGESGVIKTGVYQEFMKKFDCEHIFTCSDLFQIEENLLKLPLLRENFKHMTMVSTFNHYFPDNFPDVNANTSLHSQFFQSVKEITGKHHAKYNLDSFFNNQFQSSLVKVNHQYNLIPAKPGFEPIKTENVLKKKASFEETAQFMKNYTKFLNSKKKSEEKSLSTTTFDPTIIFLGTGSMIPSTYRGVSGIFFDYGSFNLLMDCGEGSYFQLLNQFGFERLHREVLPKIRVIFISHIHVDHHAGIFTMLSQRKKALESLQVKAKDDPLFLVVPGNLMPWYFKYVHYIEDFEGVLVILNQSLGIPELELKENIANYSFSKNHNMMQGTEGMELEYYEDPLMKPLLEAEKFLIEVNMKEFHKFLTENQITEFLPVFVDHCPQAHGLVITHKSGIKIVYSGDTRPCETLVKYGANATILIHEATFNDSLEKNASENMHSTVGEAVSVARKMGVWRLILTHFSQRYSKNSMTGEEKRELKKTNKGYYDFLKEKTVWAYDHLGGKVSEFEHLPLLSHCMQEMFPNDEER